MKKRAVMTEANPVLPPAPTPAADSTYAVVVDVPKMAPIDVADESASKARPARGSLLSFTKPA